MTWVLQISQLATNKMIMKIALYSLKCGNNIYLGLSLSSSMLKEFPVLHSKVKGGTFTSNDFPERDRILKVPLKHQRLFYIQERIRNFFCFFWKLPPPPISVRKMWFPGATLGEYSVGMLKLCSFTWRQKLGMGLN